MTSLEKVAYLKGLIDGLDVDAESKEGKLFNAIASVLEELASDVEDLQACTAMSSDMINDISDSVADLEYIVYNEDEENLDEFDDEFDEIENCDYNCDDCGLCFDGDDEDYDEIENIPLDDTAMYEVTCPGCNANITVDENILALGKIECPSCGNMLEFDLKF